MTVHGQENLNLKHLWIKYNHDRIDEERTIHGDAHTSMTVKISCDVAGFPFSSFVLSVSGVKCCSSNPCEQQK